MTPDRPLGADAAAVPSSKQVAPVDAMDVLHKVLLAGARRVHIVIGESCTRILSRLHGQLQAVAEISVQAGNGLADTLAAQCRDDVGHVSLGDGSTTLHYRLVTSKSAVGRTIVITPLPAVDTPPARTIQELEAPDEVSQFLTQAVAGGRGLLLIAGPPDSRRWRTKNAIIAEVATQDASLLGLSYDHSPHLDGGYATLQVDPKGDIWSFLERVEGLDADCVILPEICESIHANLALAVTGGRRLGLAPILAADAAGALVRFHQLNSNRNYRVARNVVGVVAQRRHPRPCAACSSLHPLTDECLPDGGWDRSSRAQLLAKNPKVRARGGGCSECQGSGYSGWSFLYECLVVDEMVAGCLRSISEAGMLREQLKTMTTSRGLMEEAWRQVLRGVLEPDELASVPGPEVKPLRLGRSSLSQKPVMVETPPARVTVAGGSAAVMVTDGAGTPSTGAAPSLLQHLRAVLQTILENFRLERPIDLGVFETVAGQIITATEREPELVHKSLTRRSGDELRHQPLGDDLLNHQLYVAFLAVSIGIGLNWDKAKLVRLAEAALVHDMGLLKVPVDILTKKKISKKEEAVRRQHAVWSAEMAGQVLPDFDWLPVVIRQIHERESGRGFPEGLKGDQIDQLAKVIGLADVLETLTNVRPWRVAMTPFDAIQHVMKERAADHDRRILKAMLHRISLFPVSSLVVLNNGSLARVLDNNPENFYRPRVEIIQDKSGDEVASGHEVDLADSPFMYITGPFRDGDDLPAPDTARAAREA